MISRTSCTIFYFLESIQFNITRTPCTIFYFLESVQFNIHCFAILLELQRYVKEHVAFLFSL